MCVCVCVCAQSCLTLCNPMPQGLELLIGARQAFLYIKFSNKHTGVGCHFLLQRIFLTQELNLHLLRLLHWKVKSSPLRHLGSPRYFIKKFKYITSKNIVNEIYSLHRLICKKKKLKIYFQSKRIDHLSVQLNILKRWSSLPRT